MKTWEIEVRRTSYVTIWVEADTQEEAEQRVWKDIESNTYRSDGVWEIHSIDEVEE